MSKRNLKKVSRFRRGKRDKDGELEYKTWGAFLLIPFMWMVSQVFVLVFVLFRDYFELVAFIIIIIMIIAMYFYIKYWR